MNRTIVQLIPPLLTDDNIKEKILCIRGHRERIFNVSTQLSKGKLICHNYGQGGAGWTFLFGCVNKSISQFESQLLLNPSFKNKPISVIGAGCYGLLSAIILARKGYNVSIVASDIENISSYKAAGFFFPRPRKVSTPEEIAIFEELGIDSYLTYLQIINALHPFINTGAQLLPAYYSMDIDPGFGPYLAKKLIEIPQQVTIDFQNGKKYKVIRYKTVFIDANKMMKELNRNISDLGIKIDKAQINSFDEIEHSIIFNCAGLGAKDLAFDNRLIPVQGHLITLQNQPNINQLQYMINNKLTMTNPKGMPRDELIYFAPKAEGILGITFLRGQNSLNANSHEFDRLLARCRDFFGY